MRIMIQDKVSHNFIEGPMQSSSVNSIYQEGNDDKAAHHADLSQGYDVEEDANIEDTDKPIYEVNERYNLSGFKMRNQRPRQLDFIGLP